MLCPRTSNIKCCRLKESGFRFLSILGEQQLDIIAETVHHLATDLDNTHLSFVERIYSIIGKGMYTLEGTFNSDQVVEISFPFSLFGFFLLIKRVNSHFICNHALNVIVLDTRIVTSLC